MSKMKIYLLCVLSGISVTLGAFAQSNDPNAAALMTAQDLRDSSLSNVTIINRTPAPVSVNALFIASYDTSDTASNCSMCFGGIVSGDNVGGVMASQVTFPVDSPVPIGQNYLYNMIYNGIYFIRNTAGSSPCSLPGCSWPSDTPNIKWCIAINAVSLNSNYTYNPTYKNGSNPAAAVPAYGEAGLSPSSQFDYNYDLINPTTLGTGSACIGPVTCNDKTMTCSVGTPQHETFQSY